VLAVRDDAGADTGDLIAERPSATTALCRTRADDSHAYVTNAVDGTMSVISLTGAAPAVVGNPIAVGVEPRGIAITPNGGYAFIANHTAGMVTVVKLAPSATVIGTVATGGNPQSIAITNDGDDDDLDEQVFVTRIFGELIDPAARPDGYDDAKQGIVDTFKVGAAVDGPAAVYQLTLAPRDSGFVGDRRAYCLNTRLALQSDPVPTLFFNSGEDGTGDGASQIANATFCPDPTSNDASADGPIANTPQGVYPNMLHAVLVRGPLLYVPNVGAQPEPPVEFNKIVQGMVGVLDRIDGVETDGTVNLNQQIDLEAAGQNGSLKRLFASDIVAIDANRIGTQFLVVSRGNNYVMRVDLDANQHLSIGDPAAVVRFQTGNTPTGVVMSSDGSRAYAYNDIGLSVTAIDLTRNTVIERDLSAIRRRRVFRRATACSSASSRSTPRSACPMLRHGRQWHLRHRAARRRPAQLPRAPDNGRASCATWATRRPLGQRDRINGSGPRQTIPLEGSFARAMISVTSASSTGAARAARSRTSTTTRAA
jgi:DNA-binding beta-propeller fold protein YncE